MKTVTLKTSNPRVTLIEPNIERDAQLGLEWLNSETGRQTLALMGVAEDNNTTTDIETERKRIEDFITKENQLNWMIKLDENVVGSIWVDLEDTNYLSAPAVHIMIGDPDARGQGVGSVSTASVINHLKDIGYKKVYSRTLISNSTASKLLLDGGFKKLGEIYQDADGINWQNCVLEL